jgi:hypothetical protein
LSNEIITGLSTQYLITGDIPLDLEALGKSLEKNNFDDKVITRE